MAKKKTEPIEELKPIEEPIAVVLKDPKADFVARKLAVINLIADEDKARKMANRILFNK